MPFVRIPTSTRYGLVGVDSTPPSKLCTTPLGLYLPSILRVGLTMASPIELESAPSLEIERLELNVPPR